jgi:F0F1-type ATP synthase membrane subunit c/vacuolar-type H+-ATPase subunit K
MDGVNGCLLVGYCAIAGFVGLVVGSVAGLVVGAVTGAHARGQNLAGRVAIGFGITSGLGTLGLVIGLLLGAYLAYTDSVKDGPPHGYPNRAAYRDAEMQHRAGQLEPVILALEKYKADHNGYPASLDELVAGKYLDALPPVKSAVDHLGQPGRVNADHTRYEYTASVDRKAFALRTTCVFTEDRWEAAPRWVSQVYRSEDEGWTEQEGPWMLPWPRAPAAAPPQKPKDAPELAPPPREVK